MIRNDHLKILRKEAKTFELKTLSKRIGITYSSLWRIVNQKSKGSASNWDKIFKYYGQ
jgi:predicted transcriptional regulator